MRIIKRGEYTRNRNKEIHVTDVSKIIFNNSLLNRASIKDKLLNFIYSK